MSSLSKCDLVGLQTPITEIWADFNLSTDELNPNEEFAQPGSCIVDFFPDHVAIDSPPPLVLDGAKGLDAVIKRVEWRDACWSRLWAVIDLTMMKSNEIVIASDASVPYRNYQAVAAWKTWFKGGLVDDD